MTGKAWAINASSGAPSYDSDDLRRLLAPLESPKGTAGTNRFAATEGVRVGSGVIASLSGSTITVAAHAGVISPDLTTTQGAYLYELDANETHSLTAAHATLARVDLVYVQISDTDADASGARTVASGYLAGTAGGGAPSLPARSFEVARIAVPASGGGSPALTESQQYSVASGGVLPVRDTAARPAHYEGRVIYQMDTNQLLLSDGAGWVAPGGGGAVVAPAHRTSDLSFTAETDAAALNPATLVSGRRYKLSFKWKGFAASGSANNNVVVKFKEGGTQYDEWNVIVDDTTARGGGSHFATLDCTTDISAGSHTFKVTVQRAVGASTITLHAGATYKATLLLEDIGPV